MTPTPAERAAGLAYLAAIGTLPISTLDADLDKVTGSFERSTRVLAVMQTERGVAMALHPTSAGPGTSRTLPSARQTTSPLADPLSSSSDTGQQELCPAARPDRWLRRAALGWLTVVAFALLVGAVKGWAA